MKIKTVTITGADNRTNLINMVALSHKYPFVEWGILFSQDRKGSARFPNDFWLDQLVKYYFEGNDGACNFSAHLCGEYVKPFLHGRMDSIDRKLTQSIWGIFRRFQLNFNSTKYHVDVPAMCDLLKRIGQNFILQYNKANEEVCEQIIIGHIRGNYDAKISFLYDSSGGRGNVAGEYHRPLRSHFTGYAGGLSPDNLEAELKRIEAIAGNSEVWIDVESGVRTNDILDIKKVKAFLEIASTYVK